ncbi:MAG: TatD family hydrolase [Gammaproteobacteria bacterium]|nr:TatD family hydrolase [Gammaproteobacteria bacterium]
MHMFDTHCHIDVEEFDADRDQVLQSSKNLGVGSMLVPAVARRYWDGLLALCSADRGLYPALGLHPVYIDTHTDDDLADLTGFLENGKPAAIGEIGLDYYVAGLDRERQQHFFEAQLKLAQVHQLPVVLHVRKAHDQVLATLEKIPVVGGFAHAFNGSLQQARRYVELGFKLGFGGTMTYPHSSKIHTLARSLSLNDIVLETDAPDMTVASHRGERNSPEYLPECATALAALRRTDIETVVNQTTANARLVLNIHD